MDSYLYEGNVCKSECDKLDMPISPFKSLIITLPTHPIKYISTVNHFQCCLSRRTVLINANKKNLTKHVKFLPKQVKRLFLLNAGHRKRRYSKRHPS